MQPALNAARGAVSKGLPAAAMKVPKQVANSLSDQTPAVPDWFTKLERESQPVKNVVQREQTAATPEQDVAPKRSSGAHYNLFLGANLSMYSTAEAETKLRNMHEPNHRTLKISQIAARVADFLWPGCQDSVDEAIAKHKMMAARSRIHVPEPEYVPPEVPGILPVTSWIRNNEEIRESFVCDENTRYKPRMAWYNPNDGMFPSNWFSEGLMADLKYYKPFVGLRSNTQKW